MDLATPVFALASALTAATPALESAPYVGDPPIFKCEYLVDGRWQPKVSPTQTDLGAVCRFTLPSTLGEGYHTARGRYWVRVNDVQSAGPMSSTFLFRKYSGSSGATFWTWESAVICDPDCVSE